MAHRLLALSDIHFQVVLARLAAEWHVADFGIRPDGEQRLAAMRTAVPWAVMYGFKHIAPLFAFYPYPNIFCPFKKVFNDFNTSFAFQQIIMFGQVHIFPRSITTMMS